MDERCRGILETNSGLRGKSQQALTMPSSRCIISPKARHMWLQPGWLRMGGKEERGERVTVNIAARYEKAWGKRHGGMELSAPNSPPDAEDWSATQGIARCRLFFFPLDLLSLSLSAFCPFVSFFIAFSSPPSRASLLPFFFQVVQNNDSRPLACPKWGTHAS